MQVFLLTGRKKDYQYCLEHNVLPHDSCKPELIFLAVQMKRGNFFSLSCKVGKVMGTDRAETAHQYIVMCNGSDNRSR